MLSIYVQIFSCLLLLSVEGEKSSCEEHNVYCHEPLVDHCCSTNYYHCCDYDEYRKEEENRDVGDSFVETGLKSALVLLIMSSAIFLVCFCLLRCCRRAVGRQNPMRQGNLTERQQPRNTSDRHADRNSILIAMFNTLNLTPPASPVTDEPPSYNEVVGDSDAVVEVPDPDDPPPIEDTSSIHDKPPPEYASIFKQSDIP